MTGRELIQRQTQLTVSLAHLRDEATSLNSAIGEAMIDDPSRAEALRLRLRSIRDQIESTEAALTALRPRLALASAEEKIVRRVAAASTVRDQLDVRDRALADIDRALGDLGDAFDRLIDAHERGSRAANIAEDGDRTLGRAQVATAPLASLFPDRAVIEYCTAHAVWHHAPAFAKAMRLPTHGTAKHRKLIESLGRRIEFEPEALGEVLREMAVSRAVERIRPVATTAPDDGVRIARVA